MKRCPRCDGRLPVTAFSRAKNEPSGRQAYCKPCMAEYRSALKRGEKPIKVRRQTVERDESGLPITKRCPKCEQVLPAAEFQTSSIKGGARLYSYCRACWHAYQRTRLEYIEKYNREYYEQTKKRALENAAAYYLEHKEERQTYAKARYAAKRSEILALSAARGQSLKLAALNAYGGPTCSCCGEGTVAFLTLDHVNNDGGQHRKITGAGTGFYNWLRKHAYPADVGLRVLCFNCNQGRRVNGGVCPHQIT